jgi:hypothetical protein
MAQGDVVFFQQFLVDVLEGVHNLETNTINLGLTDGTTTPTEATADPRWGTGGTTNFSAEECTTGGAYTGPVALANPAVSWNNSRAEIDWDDPATWSQNASSPTDATWGIIYNDTAAGKQCIGYVDLGGAFNMTTGDLTITFGTPAAYLDHA